MIFQDPLTSLNPLYRIGDQLVETIRTHLNLSETGGAQARHRSARRGRHSRAGQAHRRLSARVFRRHAAARGDCAGDLRRAGIDHRRRADHRARCIRAGPDHLIDKTARPRPWHRGDAGDPRYGRDRGDFGPGGGDVFRPHRRDRSGAGRGAASAASLCQGPDGRDPDARRRRQARLVQIPGSMPRLSAIPPGCAFNPRCAFAFDRCRIERPEPIRHGTQDVACHLYDTAAKENAA